MWVNTELFRTEATHFKKYGYYCPDPPGSYAFRDYWTEQLQRCREGYSVGGQRITGHHYGYLNFGQIKLTEDNNKYQSVVKKKISSAHKVVTFPDFWDGDYEYFIALEEAWNEGKHMLVFKARRKGFSYKNGFICANRANTIKNSVSLIGAFETKYLYPKGTMTMAADYMNFFNEHTGWTKRRLIDKRDHIKTGYYVMRGGVRVEKGYKSEIIAVTYKDNPDAARGKDASLILFEEGGAFSNLKAAYMATRPTVEDGSVVTGQIIIYGTGGDMFDGTVDLEDMFYNPAPYNLKAFENIWDDDAKGTICGFFVPVQKNLVGYIDKDGNSDIQGAIDYQNSIRQLIKDTAKDPKALDQYITEYPQKPAEGFMRVSSNIFPVAAINEWRNRLLVNKKFNIGVPGRMYRDENGKAKFQPDPSAKPITKFPHNEKEDDLRGCVVIWQAPYYDEATGQVPPGLYITVNDPYAFDKSASSISLGAAYVYKYVNGVSKPDDWLVAGYVGRPDSQDEFNEQMFLLNEYYNGKIGFENDRGDVVGYAKRTRSTHVLLEEVGIIDARENINIRKLGRIFGISCGTEQRKAQGDIFIRDWLKEKRGTDEDGKPILNLHMIYDVALLDELLRYNPKGNFDRVSALRILAFYMKAHVINMRPPAHKGEKPRFLNKAYYQ